MELVTSFLLVLLIETIQNLPAMVGVVLGLTNQGWRRYVYPLLAMVFASFLIAFTEPFKLMGTTLTREHTPTFSGMLTYGIIMGVATCIYLIYATSRWSNAKTDLWVGIVLAGFIPLLSNIGTKEVLMSIRFWWHTISFMVAAILVLKIFRKTFVSKPENPMVLIFQATAVLTIPIVLIDYGPFLKGF